MKLEMPEDLFGILNEVICLKEALWVIVISQNKNNFLISAMSAYGLSWTGAVGFYSNYSHSDDEV